MQIILKKSLCLTFSFILRRQPYISAFPELHSYTKKSGTEVADEDLPHPSFQQYSSSVYSGQFILQHGKSMGFLAATSPPEAKTGRNAKTTRKA
ncbi:hypothetical protein [Prevotella sp. KH2C16]|uniref:hypothetical protein n=1 Tax=Prevotella sp. KH2C16 TaxID=1855325 RepID=UPI0011604C9A|nr:hypothetical protein [Prevotella sp. KH2C16]